MKILITDVINEILADKLATEVNDKFILHMADFLTDSLPAVITRKKDIIKRFFFQKQEQDTIFDNLYFQADESSRNSVITPRATKALQAIVEGNTAWSAIIVSTTKDANGLDIVKTFTAQEMLDFADVVVADVENYFIQGKLHRNAVEGLTTIQEVIDYDFS